MLDDLDLDLLLIEPGCDPTNPYCRASCASGASAGAAGCSRTTACATSATCQAVRSSGAW